jgi:fluoride ion exporter CrcB/FEX
MRKIPPNRGRGLVSGSGLGSLLRWLTRRVIGELSRRFSGGMFLINAQVA